MSAVAEWLRHRRTGLFRLWLLAAAVWIAASVFLVPPLHQTPYVTGSVASFDRIRPICIRDTIQLTDDYIAFSEIAHGSSLKFGPVDYFFSRMGHPYTSNEVQRRAEALAANTAYVRLSDRYIEYRKNHKPKVDSLDIWLGRRDGTSPPTVPQIVCVSVKMTTENLIHHSLWAVGPIFLVPLAVALAIFFIWAAWSIVARTFRWVAAGFKPLLPSNEFEPKGEAQVDTVLPLAPAGQVKSGYAAKSIIKGILIVILVTLVTAILSGITRQWLTDVETTAYEGRRVATGFASNPASTKRLRQAEAAIRKQLPIQVTEGVAATNVQLDDRGMRWTYQVDGRLLGRNPAEWFKRYSLAIRQQACRNQAVLEILAAGFEVSYSVESPPSGQLGTVTVAECS